jgi:hypothetical protein
MKRFWLLLIIFCSFALTAHSQEPDFNRAYSCPGKIFITKENDNISRNQIIVVVAEFATSSYDGLKFKWTVTGGEIVEGLGTQRVKIKTSSSDAVNEVRATFEIIGLDASCENKASLVIPLFRSFSVLKVDDYGKLTWKDEKERLLNLIVFLQDNPDQNILIEIYVLPERSAKHIKSRIEKLGDHLINTKKIESKRLQFVAYNSEYKREQTIFQPYPRSASVPILTFLKQRDYISGESLAAQLSKKQSK